MLKRFGLVLILCSIVPLAMADTVIESFENANPAGWRTTSPMPGQDRNVASPRYSPIPEYVTEHVTHGAAAGRFGVNWALPGADSPANPNIYESGGTTFYWALRISTASGAALGSIPVSAEIHADIYNRTADPMQFAFVVLDTGLERGPLVTLAPNAPTTYVWKLSDGCTAWITGNGTWDTGTVTMNSMLLYTTTAPTVTQFTFDIDNVRLVTAQTDFEAPAPVTLLSAKQGTNPGDVVLNWVANTEADLDSYRIYMATDANFGTNNRMVFPTTPIATAPKTATSATISGVTTEQTLYFRMTALDNATPQQNESARSIFMAVRLRADGGTNLDQIVLDLDRYTYTSPYFIDACYYHMSVYNAQALAANDRNFVSCLARAVADGDVVLAPSTSTLVVWSNAMDGDQAGSAPVGGVGLSDANVGKLTSFLDAGGRLMISGTGYITDLNAGSAPKQAFLADKIRATLLSDNIASDTINTSGPFFSLPLFRTGPNMWDFAAWTATHNDQLAARSGALSAMDYNTAQSACVYYDQVVAFGFAFEMVRPDPCTSFAQGAAARAALMGNVTDYLTSAPVDTPTPSTAVREFEIYE